MKLEDVILRGDRASQPAFGSVPVGTLYCVTDEDDIIERSSGAAWESYSPVISGGFPAPISRLVSSAEINSLNSSPIELVPAPGAGKIIVPVKIIYWFTRTTTAFTADPTIRTRYAGIATDLFSGVSFFMTTASAGETFRTLEPTDYNFGYGGSDPRNAAIQLSASVNNTTGTGTLKVGLAYYILEP